jgi:hypothetical protein
MTTTNLMSTSHGVGGPSRAVTHRPAHNNTCCNIKHAFLTPRSFATCSTISRVTTIMSGASPSRPSFPRILRRPHSFIANAASSILRFVARARSANVHFTTTWVVALPSRFCVVAKVLNVLNKGSTADFMILE